MLPDLARKVKGLCTENKSDLFTGAVIFLVGLGSFGLGRLSALWPHKELLRIQNILGAEDAAPISSSSPLPQAHSTAGTNNALRHRTTPGAGSYVGSAFGSIYHFPWCPGAARIKEENKIWFATKEEAATKGYKPAGNCPGL